MSGYNVSPLALLDLEDIDSFISLESQRAATQVIDRLWEAFATIGQTPGLGHTRSDLTALPVRFWTVGGRYMIVYREQPGVIEIVRVISAGRDVRAILG